MRTKQYTKHNLQWFIDRKDKRIYRDVLCACDECVPLHQGIVVADPEDMFKTQNEYAEEGVYLNYRDTKEIEING